MKKMMLTCCLTAIMIFAGACGEEEETVSVVEGTVEAEEDTLRIGISPDYAPFAYEVDAREGELAIAGSDVELGKYIAEGLDLEAEFCVMEFEECLSAVQEGSVDLVLLGMLPKAGRKSMMDFTDVYYEPGKQVMLVQKADRMELSSLEALGGKTVAAQYGTLQAQLVVEQLPESYLELTDDVSGAVMKLRMGAVDAVALDQAVAEEVVKEYTELAVSAAALLWMPDGIVGGVAKDQPELLEKINEILAQVTEEKLYYGWLEDAFKRAAALPVQ